MDLTEATISHKYVKDLIVLIKSSSKTLDLIFAWCQEVLKRYKFTNTSEEVLKKYELTNTLQGVIKKIELTNALQEVLQKIELTNTMRNKAIRNLTVCKTLL